MDYLEKVKRETNPKQHANVISSLLFFYTVGLFQKGYKKELEEPDLYKVLPAYQSKKLGDKIEKQWKTREKQSIFRLLWKCFGNQYLLLGLVKVLYETPILILKPIAFGKLVSYFSPGQTELTKSEAVLYAVLVLGIQLVESVCVHNYFLSIIVMGLKIRSACCSFMYRKILKMPPEKLQEISIGKIVTMMTKDIDSLEVFLDTAHDLWIGLFKVAVMTYMMYRKVGTPGLIGTSLFLFILPIQVYSGFIIKTVREKTLEKSDQRLKATQETVSAIKVIKMYAWENFFDAKITEYRKKEIGLLQRMYIFKYLVLILGFFTKHMGFYLVLMSYIWLGNSLTAEVVYFITTCFTQLREMLSILLPMAIYHAAELIASGRRIESIINAMENPEFCRRKTNPEIILNKVSVSIKDKEVLNISKEFVAGLNVVYGPVGSGKTILLKTIMHECRMTTGYLQVKGRISYASQEPWVFPSTIKQNILFGEKYDAKRYQKVLNVCALIFDLELWEKGDLTIVEDKGINLSKGQKTRINLARAVYRDVEIYLLDDVLATLDAHVSDFIFNECIRKFLEGKLVILVTNKPSLDASNVIVMDDGKLATDDCRELQKTVEEYIETDRLIETEQFVTKKVYHETKKVGVVDWSIYKKYFNFGGGWGLFCVIISVYIIAQFLDSSVDKLVSDWVNIEEEYTNLTRSNPDDGLKQELQEKRTRMAYVYTGMNIALHVALLLRVVTVICFARAASINIHKYMTKNIINATMHFFDTHFIGNILNRLSKDLMVIDEFMPFTIYHIIDEFISLFGFLYLITTVNPVFMIPAAVFFAVLFYWRRYYIKTGRCLKRLESVVRSPMIGYLNSTLEGLPTIRAFRKEDILRNEFDEHQNLYTSCAFIVPSIDRAFTFIIDCFGTLFMTIVITTILVIDNDTKAGSVGLVLSQAIRLAEGLQFGIKYWASFENMMTSTERALEYTEIQQENRTGIVTEISSNAEIVYENVSLTYPNTTEKVLRNISFAAKSNEKIGIVGRTGSGKSSIASVLFKLYDIEGRILVGGVDIKTLSLDFLRSKISIIPQDPVLFSGDIRSNIDPTGSHSDQEIWSAIEAANLKELIGSSLEFEIFENNLSIGQKQLMCIARAIIRKNNIIILDEATANMDFETDKLIHKTIKKCFSSCTVFVIAHRLSSVMDSDKIIVMDKGEIVEMGAPGDLLRTHGVLFKMVQKSKQ